MQLKARVTPLLALVLLLAGCGSDSPPAEQLQSITVKNAEGAITALTVLDYSQGSLVRVRSYNQPGEDGVVGTADDPLFNNAYAICRVMADDASNSGTYRGLLHDAYAEAHGGSPVSIFFQPFSDCALPGISASSIANTSYNHPGPDERWFTADDVKSLEFTLSRRTTGSELILSAPAGLIICTLGCAGLDPIVYNPYAGLDLGSQTTSITYDRDASSRVHGFISQTGQQTLYERQDDGFIKVREINHSNNNVAGAIGPFRLREEYEKTSSGNVRVRSLALLNQGEYDVLAAVGGSPVAQILLAIMGIARPTGEQLTGLDGNTYYVSATRPRYEMEKTGERIDRIRQITDPGTDTVWHTGDDVIGAVATFSYAIPH